MTQHHIDPEQVAAIIVDAAEKFIVPRYRLLENHQIQSKSSPNDLVTIADQETEAALEQALGQLYPGALVIGEESVSAGAKDICALAQSDKTIFVADPVDGTWNFVHGKREFCVMLACVIGGETRFGWIYDVIDQKMMIVEKGAGAFFGGEKMQVAAPKAPQALCGHAGLKYFPPALRPHVKAYKTQVKSLYSLGCAGHEYLRLAAGSADFGIYSRIRQWDHLAGVLAVQEAGGYVAQWDGSPYTPCDAFGGLVVAASRDLWQHVHDTLIEPMMTEAFNEPAE